MTDREPIQLSRSPTEPQMIMSEVQRNDKMRVKRRIPQSRVAITQDPYEGKAIRDAIDLLTPDGLVRSDDTVVITPNWVKDAAPSTGTVVGPESLRELIRWVKERSPKRIVVACGSGGGDTLQIMENVGYRAVIDEEAVEFVDLNHGPFTEIELEMDAPLNKIKVNKLYDEMSILISYSQIKVHEEATVSLGIKNIALSWPPAEIHGFPKKDKGIHENLHEFITAMARRFPIDLTVLSSDKGMVGHGPSGGKAVDADIVVAGTDPVATDVVGTRLLGFRPQAVRYLHNLIRGHVGNGEINEIQLFGLPLDQAELAFSQAAYGTPIAIDKGKLQPVHLS